MILIILVIPDRKWYPCTVLLLHVFPYMVIGRGVMTVNFVVWSSHLTSHKLIQTFWYYLQTPKSTIKMFVRCRIRTCDLYREARLKLVAFVHSANLTNKYLSIFCHWDNKLYQYRCFLVGGVDKGNPPQGWVPDKGAPVQIPPREQFWWYSSQIGRVDKGDKFKSCFSEEIGGSNPSSDRVLFFC